jgi:hypothetical protein
MSSTPSVDEEQLHLRERLLEMSRAYMLSRAIHVAAELGLANHVGDAAVRASELARLTSSSEPHLERLLRFLAGYGIFAEATPGSFVATPLSKLLADGHPSSMRAGLSTVNSAWWAAAGDLGHSVRTGETAFDFRHGQTFFAYLKDNPSEQQRFDAGMASNSCSSDQAIARAYDFSRCGLLIDVGGGRGGLLRAILERHANVSSQLFDQPQVVSRQAAALEADAALQGRLSCIAGDFFEAVPHGGDIYLLKGVLHDFDDERCIQILKNCRRAMRPQSKLLIIERLISPDNRAHQAKTIDLLMMVLLGGRERAASEWTELLRAADLQLCQQLTTDSEFTISEAAPI